MRWLLIVFTFYASYVVSDQEKNVVKSFPKKYKSYESGKILINSGKYNHKTTVIKSLKTNGEVKNSKYTVFPVVGKTKGVHNVPESPYFSIDQPVEPKPRVKKFLPDIVWHSPGRHKRSVGTPELRTGNNSNSQLTRFEQRKGRDERADKKTNGNVSPISKAAEVEESKSLKTFQLNPKKQPMSKSINKGLPKSSKTSHVAYKKLKHKSSKKEKKSHKKTRTKNIAGGRSNKTKSRETIKSKRGSKGKSIRRISTSMRKDEKRQGKLNSKHKSLKKQKSQKLSKGNLTKNKIIPDTRRLTSAKETVIEDYPYVVSIQKDGQHWCSGALLNPRLVVTTANCLWKSRSISRMQVRAGSSFTDRGGQLVGIQEVVKHPKWGLRKNPDHDVALVLLDTKIKFSHSVHGVDLPNRIMLPAFDDAWVTSWGSETRDGIFDRYENTLQVYHTKVMNHELCNNITLRFGVEVTENFICLSQSGKTSPCTRDTGAPAVSDGVVWGLASWGIRKLCGTERFPSMFSYLASRNNMDFIVNATSYLMSDERRYPFLDRTRSYKKSGNRTLTTDSST